MRLCPAENGSNVPGKNATGLSGLKRKSAAGLAERDEAVEMVEHRRFVEKREHAVPPLAKEGQELLAESREARAPRGKRAGVVSEISGR